MKNILIMLICGIVMLCSTKVFAFETESSITVDKIKLTANKCNIKIENSEDDKIHYDYDNDKFTVETNATDEILNINVKNSNIKCKFVIVKIPNIDMIPL